MANNFPQKPWNFAWQYIKKYFWVIVLFAIITPFTSLVHQLLPWLAAKVADQISTAQSPELIWDNVFQYLLYICIALVTSFVLNMIILIITEYKLTGDLRVSVGKDLFAAIIPHSRTFWQTNPPGSVFNKLRILGKRCGGEQGYVGIWWFLLRRSLDILVVIGLLASIYLPFAIYTVIFLMLLTYLMSKISNNVEEAAKQRSDANSKAFAKMIDMCNNYFLIKIFGTKKREYEHFSNSLDDMKLKAKNFYQKHLNNTITQQILSLMFQVSFILYAVYLWSQKTISVGDLVYIFATLPNLMGSFRIFGYVFLELKSCKGDMNSAIPTFNEEYEIKDGKKNLKIKEPSIELKDVFFSYDGKKDVIKGISFKIKPKEKVGIVGVSGGGKTTLSHLIQRIYELKSGEILIDGQNIQDVSLNSLYKNIAFIPQDTTLFHRSILENAIYGSFSASSKKQKEAFNSSHIDEFVEKLPKGYDTIVGDKGVKLSGGQRQRIGISRAILKDAPILILDEATSALDSKSEEFIQQAIQQIIKDKTVVAIAHRLSTLREMDRIIVVDKGKIIQDGTPQELLKKKGKFAKLWKIQMDI